jgi:hypothetical protein
VFRTPIDIKIKNNEESEKKKDKCGLKKTYSAIRFEHRNIPPPTNTARHSTKY